MIRLKFVRKPLEEQQTIVNAYYQKLLEGRNTSFLEKINTWCKSNLSSLIPEDSLSEERYSYFEQVVIADYQTLYKLYQYLHTNNLRPPKKLARYMKGTLYNSIDKSEFARKLKVSVCPYCNRNYINAGDKSNNCQIDHFFNKSDYPILAVSFYNLVPVCGSCNHKKQQSTFNHSPFDPKLGTDELLRFTYLPKSIDFLYKEDQLEIQIEYLHEKLLENDLSRLDLLSAYKLHRNRIIDLFKLKTIYDKSYISQIVNKYPDLFRDEDEVAALLAGTLLEEKDYQERPLSKFLTDISRELGIIGE